MAGLGGSSIVPSASPTSTERASSAARPAGAAGLRPARRSASAPGARSRSAGGGVRANECGELTSTFGDADAQRLGLEQDRLAEVAAELHAQPALRAVRHRSDRGTVGEAVRVGPALELPARD